MSDWDIGPPHAQVQRIGRWTYLVSVHHGLSVWGPNASGWSVLGRRRANRKAAKVLARYLRDEGRRADVTRLEAP